MASYKSFIHVERLGRTETDGILKGKVFCTPKLDGCNSVLFWDDKNDCIGAGSRNRKLSLDKDNAGFCEWVHGNSEEMTALLNFLMDNPGVIIYGEWGVGKVGNIKDYDREAHNQLWIFDMFQVKLNRYLSYDEIELFAAVYGFKKWVVPVLAILEDPTEEDILEVAKNNFFLLKNANHPGEGVVIRNYEFHDAWGNYQVGKLVLDEYKQYKGKGKNKLNDKRIGCEQNIVDTYLTDAEMAKAKAKVTLTLGADEFDNNDNKFIGMYLNMCFKDAILEEITDIVKKYKRPVIDFQVLQNLTFIKGREYIGL